MKKTKKLLITACFTTLLFAMTGCTMDDTVDMTLTADGKASYTYSSGIDDTSLTFMVENFMGCSIEEYKQQMAEQGSVVTEGTAHGEDFYYNAVTDENLPISAAEEMVGSSLPFSNVCLTTDYFYGEYREITASDKLSTAPKSILSKLNKDDMDDQYSNVPIKYYVQFSLTFPSAIQKTNGTIDPSNPNKVTFACDPNTSGKSFYAMTYTPTTTTAKVKGIKNGKVSKKALKLAVSNKSSVYKMTLNGKKVSPNKTVKANGRYSLAIWSKNGKCQVTQFIIDKKAPTITGVKNKKTYKKNMSIKIQDTVSGLKSVTVNGEPIEIETVTTGDIMNSVATFKTYVPGKYKIVAKDMAGNTKTVTFTIK